MPSGAGGILPALASASRQSSICFGVGGVGGLGGWDGFGGFAGSIPAPWGVCSLARANNRRDHAVQVDDRRHPTIRGADQPRAGYGVVTCRDLDGDARVGPLPAQQRPLCAAQPRFLTAGAIEVDPPSCRRLRSQRPPPAGGDSDAERDRAEDVIVRDQPAPIDGGALAGAAGRIGTVGRVGIGHRIWSQRVAGSVTTAYKALILLLTRYEGEIPPRAVARGVSLMISDR
jgi:hypothetical protein